MIDFSFPPDVDEVRLRVREFMDTRVRPEWEQIDQSERRQVVECIVKLREEARNEWQLWLPHMPEEWGGMALGPTAMAAVSAEAAKVSIGPFVLNAQAPDEGNQHTLLHWGTDEQKEKYLKPLCEGTARSCFAMTEPEVAGSDPTLIKTTAYQDGDEWVVNGHKWFISGARGAKFALLVARTEDDPEIPQAANSCFIVDLPSDGWEVVRDVQTMSGGTTTAKYESPTFVYRQQICGRPRPGALARPISARSGSSRALHEVDRPSGNCARHDGESIDGAVFARLAARREAGHPVAHCGFCCRAVPVQVDGAACCVSDRSENGFHCSRVDGEALCCEQFVAHHRPGDSSSRGARVFHRHAAGAHAAASTVGTICRWCRRDPSDANRSAHHRRV